MKTILESMVLYEASVDNSTLRAVEDFGGDGSATYSVTLRGQLDRWNHLDGRTVTIAIRAGTARNQLLRRASPGCEKRPLAMGPWDVSLISAASLLLLLSHPPNSTPPQKDLNRAIDAYVTPFVDSHAFSGVVLLARGDSVLAERPYGMANYELGVPNRTDTRFRIASITKWFTLIVVTRLANEKKLSLEDPLAKFAPAFPKADKITVSQLLHHRSGIRDPNKLRGIISASYMPAEVVDVLAKEPLGSEPGETYSYTTGNYAVLAFIVEKVTGQTFAEVVR